MICRCLESDGWSLACDLKCVCRCHDLMAQIDRWESATTHQATCCAKNEQRAMYLEGQLARIRALASHDC